MSLDSILVDSSSHSGPVIPVAIPAEFKFWSQFQWNRNCNFDCQKPIPPEWLEWTRFHQESVGDNKDLMFRVSWG